MKHWKLLFATLLFTISLSGCGASSSDSTGNADSPTALPTATESFDTTTTNTSDSAATNTPDVPAPDTENTQPETLQSQFAQYDMKTGTCLSSYMTGNKACVKLIVSPLKMI